ncbi:MAG TPA: hypothetical protein VJ850_04720 [Candidatus Limnocylindrales bacterium]|nr:hypothetical protein [Candidatus Limnocylindrales bacterium]
MGKQTLRITIVLGMLVTLLGGTGIFATFSDRATAGDNSVTTGQRPRAADLKIAAVDLSQLPAGATICSPAATNFTDDTTTGQFTGVGIGAIQPAVNLPDAFLCLLNAGSANLDITASAIDLVDADIDCTGDELAAGDTTCGLDQTTSQPQAGELSPLIRIAIDRVDCSDPATVIDQGGATSLDQYAAQPLHLDGSPTPGPLTPQEVACLRLRASYPTPTENQAQLAQTDQVTWKFAFDATAE